MENFICTHCNYSLTIKKTSDSSSKTKVIDVKKPGDLIEYYKINDQQLHLDIKFELKHLEEYLNNNIKEAEHAGILQFYRYNISKNISKYNLVCSTCSSEYILNPKTTIYSLNFKKQQSSFNDEVEELIDLIFKDPTLPRTKDYICKYNTCPSNQKKFDTSNKEAVFYRANGSFHMKYACVVCKGKPWNI